MERIDRAVKCLAVILAAVLVLTFFAQPYFEMQSFNKFSGKKATYWDAMFADLRIFPQEEDGK